MKKAMAIFSFAAICSSFPGLSPRRAERQNAAIVKKPEKRLRLFFVIGFCKLQRSLQRLPHLTLFRKAKEI